jgi:hypothetical protein
VGLLDGTTADDNGDDLDAAIFGSEAVSRFVNRVPPPFRRFIWFVLIEPESLVELPARR